MQFRKDASWMPEFIVVACAQPETDDGFAAVARALTELLMDMLELLVLSVPGLCVPVKGSKAAATAAEA